MSKTAAQADTATYDVAVLGGGPAGMMAAGRAAEQGARVVLLEKNPGLGEKLLITGGGRCNITNAQFDVRRLVERYGERGKPLFSVFSRFSSEDTFHFFESRGLRLKIEAEQRAFPVTDDARDVWRVMTGYMKKGGVTIKHESPVLQLMEDGGRIAAAKTKKETICAEAFILATGGKSHPDTGSTGDGFGWLKTLGIDVIEPDPALVPIAVKEPWIGELAGISLPRVKISIVRGEKILDAATGKLLFTHFGLSGPGVLNFSRKIGEAMKDGVTELRIDCFPSMDVGALDRTLVAMFDQHKNKQLKNVIGNLVPARLGVAALVLADVDGSTHLYRLSREERMRIGAVLKGFPLTPQSLLGADEAIITSGGAALEEIDFATMRCKKFENLFLAGDILDFDRPSGGFSLQICWATGWIAGESAYSGSHCV